MAAATASPNKQDMNLEIDVDVQVSSSGNMSFEVPLLPSPRVNVKSPLTKQLSSPRRDLTADELEQKLQAAEQRRQEQEAAKKERAMANDAKIVAAQKKREEMEKALIKNTEKEIKAKLDANKENRDKVTAERVEKAKKEEEKVATVREQRENNLNALAKELEEHLELEPFSMDELCTASVETIEKHMHKAHSYVSAIRHIISKGEEEETKWAPKLEQAVQQRDQLLALCKERQPSLLNYLQAEKFAQLDIQPHDRILTDVQNTDNTEFKRNRCLIC